MAYLIRLSVVILGLAFFSAAQAQNKTKTNEKTPPAASGPSLEQRVQELERRQSESERRSTENYRRTLDESGDVRSFLGEKISFGGFFETGITHISGSDMRNQLSANSNVFGLNIAADVNSDIRFVSQFLTGLAYPLQNPNNNPAVTPSQREFSGLFFGSLIAQAYADFAYNDGFHVQVGLGYVPFGQSLQLREPVLYRRRNGPQMNSSNGDTDIGVAFPLWMGVHVLGSFAIGDGRWGYNAYTFSPYSNQGNIAEGGRLWWAPSENVLTGISFQTGEEVRDRQFFAYGVDASVKFERFGVIAEYAENKVGDGLDDPRSYYVEPYMTFKRGQFLIYLAADYLDSPNHVTSTKPDAFEKWVLGGGVNWLPNQRTRVRLGYLNHNYRGNTATIAGQGRDYNSIDASVGIAF